MCYFEFIVYHFLSWFYPYYYFN